MQAACVRAGCTRGAFYAIFDTRKRYLNELLGWILTDIVGDVFVEATKGASDPQQVVSRLMASLVQDEAPSPRHRVRAAYIAVLAALPHEPGIRESHARFMQMVIDRLEESIREGQSAGTFRTDVDPRAAATALVLVAVSTLLWGERDVPLDVAGLADSFLALLGNPDDTDK